MKFLFAFALFSASCYQVIAQSVIYKKSLFDNSIEIFTSNNGIPSNSPIGIFKVNTFGFLELKQVNTQTIVAGTSSSRVQIKQVLPDVVGMKKLLDHFYNIQRQKAIQTEVNNEIDIKEASGLITDLYSQFAASGKRYSQFLSEVKNKPKNVLDGWHSVVFLRKFEKDKYKSDLGLDIKIDSVATYGFVKVDKGKITVFFEKEMFGNDYTMNLNPILSTEISECRAYVNDSGDLFEILFLNSVFGDPNIKSPLNSLCPLIIDGEILNKLPISDLMSTMLIIYKGEKSSNSIYSEVPMLRFKVHHPSLILEKGIYFYEIKDVKKKSILSNGVINVSYNLQDLVEQPSLSEKIVLKILN